MRALWCLVSIALIVVMIPLGWPLLTERPAPAPEPTPQVSPPPVTQPATVTVLEPASDDIWVEVDQKNQVVRVLKGSHVVKAMLASTGRTDARTPNGVFEIMDRGDWFFTEEFEQGAYYWVSFDDKAEFLFHSVPFDRQGKMIESEAALLGQPASHGCVRLTMEDAQWFYQNIPLNTKVVIHD